MAVSSTLIVGIPGSGKTVLFSTLVLRHRDNFWPKNDAAIKFADDAQQYLSRQEWPPPTNPLAPQKAMQWDFTYNMKKCRLFVSDKAGESWEIFVRENQEPENSNATATQLIEDLKRNLKADQAKDLETIEHQFQNAACVCVSIGAFVR